MKIALILDAEADSFLSQAQDIRALLRDSRIEATQCELWLFYRAGKPRRLPAFSLAAGQILWLRLPGAADVTEQRLALLAQGWQDSRPDVLVFTDRAVGAELAARLAYRLNGSACVGVERARVSAQACEADKAVYANNMNATLAPGAAPWCLSAARTGGGQAGTAEYDVAQREITLPEAAPDWLVSLQDGHAREENALQQAAWVLAIGQGIGGEENLHRLRPLAEALGAEIGVSRPVAMNHWCEMTRMLGISGAIAAPDVCIAAGVSGAAAFEEGIRHSRFVAAINHDPEAAIFKQADVGIVGDMHEVLAALAQCMAEDGR